MAVNWDKFSNAVERKKQIIFLVNESVLEAGTKWVWVGTCRERSSMTQVIEKTIDAFKKRHYIADIAVITFGKGANLLLPYTDIEEVNVGEQIIKPIEELPYPTTASFGTGLVATKEYIEDADDAPKDVYRPTVILVTSTQPSPGWEKYFEEFVNDGRSAKSQRIVLYTPNRNATTYSFSGTFGKNTEEATDFVTVYSTFLTPKKLTAAELRRDYNIELSEVPSAVNTFAETGFCFREEEYIGENNGIFDEIANLLTFEPLEEETLVDVKKTESNIPVLSDAAFDGKNDDEDSFI